MTSAATVRTADRIDHWIRQHSIPYCHGIDPSVSNWAMPQDQYDALATPVPPHLPALVKQLETQETVGRSACQRAA